MRKIINIFAAVWIALTGSVMADGLKTSSTTELEQQLSAIDTELDQLAHQSLRSGVGSIGYRSKASLDAEQLQWAQIDLGEPVAINQVVLVPTIWRTANEDFIDDGFPAEFRIMAGCAGDTNGTMIASWKQPEPRIPRIAPLKLDFSEITASWVRIEATRLTRRNHDDQHTFQLSELLVFSGSKNVALHRPVTVLTKTNPNSIIWSERFLVDGHLPYLMNSASSEKSLSFVSSLNEDQQAILTFDLGAPRAVDELVLHAVDQSDTVPQSSAGDLGFPRWMLVEGANRADFSDAVILLDIEAPTHFHVSPVKMWNFPATTCRYVRFTALEPFTQPYGKGIQTRFGFAEIELFSQGENVLLHRPPITDLRVNDSRRPLSALTDGRNLFGKTLPIRQWLSELARRHDLETERPCVAAELKLRYARQKNTLRWLTRTTLFLILTVGLTLLFSHLHRVRKTAQLKDRLAADLHDELGANIHTIALLGDMARRSINNPDKLIGYLDRARVFTER